MPPTKSGRSVSSGVLPTKVVEAIKREAEDQDRTVPAQVARILREWAAKVDATPKAVQEPDQPDAF